MTLKALLKLLSNIGECHPEALEAEVWAGKGKKALRPNKVGFDKRHKPYRVKLEE